MKSRKTKKMFSKVWALLFGSLVFVTTGCLGEKEAEIPGSNGGGGGESSDSNPKKEYKKYAVEVETSGLKGDVAEVQLSSGEFLTFRSDGKMTSVKTFAPGEEVQIWVTVQPKAPVQVCALSAASGIVGNENSKFTLNCKTPCVEKQAIAQDQYNVLDAKVGTPSAVVNKSCQIVTISEEMVLENFGVMMRKAGGGTTSARVSVYTMAAGATNCESGTLVAVSDPVQYDSVIGWRTFDLDSTTIEAGQYAFVVEPELDSYLYSSSGNPYSGGLQHIKMWFGGAFTWMKTASGSWDMTFRVNATYCSE